MALSPRGDLMTYGFIFLLLYVFLVLSKGQRHSIYPMTHDRFRYGKGNWRGFDMPLDHVQTVAEGWGHYLQDVSKPWLCWHVDSDWSRVQQAMVVDAGWTPVIGGDPRAGKPPVHPKAVAIDFNQGLDLPALSPMFVLEFIHLFADRLAFWHSDLLIRSEKMAALASRFERLVDGEMAAVVSYGGWRNFWRFQGHRFWELVGCSTRGASLDQFQKGCGWWMNFADHPNTPADESEQLRRRKYYWDHGVGIMYWSRRYRQRIASIKQSFVDEGHCTRINNKKYVSDSPNNATRNLANDLSNNFNLEEICSNLNLAGIYQQATR